MSTYNQFLLSLTKGAYIEINERTGNQKRVERVSNVTNTQIVVTWLGYDDREHELRFNRMTGEQRTSGAWYYRMSIVERVVTPTEIEAFEARLAERKAWAVRRAEIKILEASCREKLAQRFNCIPLDKIKVEASTNNGVTTFSVKVEGLTEDEVNAL